MKKIVELAGAVHVEVIIVEYVGPFFLYEKARVKAACNGPFRPIWMRMSLAIRKADIICCAN